MKRFLLVLLALTLFACGAAPEESEQGVQEKLDTPTVAKTEQGGEDSAEPSPVETESEPIETTQKSDQAAVSFDPATNPTEAQVVRSNDHFIGAADPDIVLIEYSDFQ